MAVGDARRAAGARAQRHVDAGGSPRRSLRHRLPLGVQAEIPCGRSRRPLQGAPGCAGLRADLRPRLPRDARTDAALRVAASDPGAGCGSRPRAAAAGRDHGLPQRGHRGGGVHGAAGGLRGPQQARSGVSAQEGALRNQTGSAHVEQRGQRVHHTADGIHAQPMRPVCVLAPQRSNGRAHVAGPVRRRHRCGVRVPPTRPSGPS